MSNCLKDNEGDFGKNEKSFFLREQHYDKICNERGEYPADGAIGRRTVKRLKKLNKNQPEKTVYGFGLAAAKLCGRQLNYLKKVYRLILFRKMFCVIGSVADDIFWTAV